MLSGIIDITETVRYHLGDDTDWWNKPNERYNGLTPSQYMTSDDYSYAYMIKAVQEELGK